MRLCAFLCLSIMSTAFGAWPCAALTCGTRAAGTTLICPIGPELSATRGTCVCVGGATTRGSGSRKVASIGTPAAIAAMMLRAIASVGALPYFAAYLDFTSSMTDLV